MAAGCTRSIQSCSPAQESSIRRCSSAQNRSRGRVSDDDRDGLRLRQQPQNVFDKSNLIEPHPNHDVLLGQQGLFNLGYFDQREHTRRCRIQVCPVLLDEPSRGRIKRDDQIGRSLSVDGLEIFDEFGLSSVVGIPSRDEGEFLDVQQPGRLLVQCLADRLAPCGPLVSLLAIRVKDQDFFRLEARYSLIGLGLSGNVAD